MGQGWIKNSSLQPVPGAWLEFAEILTPLGAHEKDVGLFAGPHGSFTIFGQKFLWDRVGGLFFWFLLFVLGAIVQCKMHEKKRTEGKEGDKKALFKQKLEARKAEAAASSV